MSEAAIVCVVLKVLILAECGIQWSRRRLHELEAEIEELKAGIP